MRVLFVIPSLLRAGAETQLVNLVNGLVERGVEASLLCFERQIDQRDRLDPRVSFVHVPRRHKFDLRPILEIRRLIDERNIDVVHCSLQIAVFMGWAGRMLSRRRPPLVVAVHTTINVSSRNEWFDRHVFRWPMRAAKKIIFVCETQKDVWVGEVPEIARSAEVVFNGIDADYFSRDAHFEDPGLLAARLGLPPGAVVVANVAAFRKEKGHAILLEAFAAVAPEFPTVYLLLVGDGPERDAVLKAVAANPFKERIVRSGSLADVRPALALAKLGVIASTSESFSIAMLETMGMGVPLVATDIGGTREAVIDGTTGVLVQGGDPRSLANGLKRALDDMDRLAAMGTTAQRMVREGFTFSKMVITTEAVLQRAVSG